MSALLCEERVLGASAPAVLRAVNESTVAGRRPLAMALRLGFGIRSVLPLRRIELARRGAARPRLVAVLALERLGETTRLSVALEARGPAAPALRLAFMPLRPLARRLAATWLDAVAVSATA